ncbi:MAG: hypothetical protein QHH15_02780 [Candidatus Thermoplasmatota archaeon]|jgi:hypothetical protein|nr:hypothetical protein [Candidatus Thermoplasmatota archaeon]
MVKFLSEEWNKLSKEYILEKLDPEKDLKNVTTSLIAIIEHVPPNDTIMSFYLSLSNGKLTDFIVNTGDISKNKEASFMLVEIMGLTKVYLKEK